MQRTFLVAVLLASTVPARAAEPVVVPFEVVGQEVAVRAKVGGTERRLLLTTDTPYSYLKNAPKEEVEIEVGGLSLGKVALVEPGPEQPSYGEDGGIGMDVLRGMAVGIDKYARKATIWPQGTLTDAQASAWVQAGPGGAGRSVVRRLAAPRLPGGAPSLSAVIEGKAMPLQLRLGFNGSILEPSVARPDVPLTKGRAILPNLSIAGLAPGWLAYYPAKEGTVNGPATGVPGALSLDPLESPRVLVDFTKDAVVVEELSPEAKLTSFLNRFAQVPVGIRGGAMYVDYPKGFGGARPPVLEPYVGCRVLRLLDESAEDWLRDLSGTDEAAARRLARRLASLTEATTVPMNVIDPDGEEVILDGNKTGG